MEKQDKLYRPKKGKLALVAAHHLYQDVKILTCDHRILLAGRCPFVLVWIFKKSHKPKANKQKQNNNSSNKLSFPVESD